MDNVATGEAAMKLASKSKLDNLHYVGTSKATLMEGLPKIDPLTHKPMTVVMNVPVNGMNYEYNITNKTVKVISYGKNVYFNLKPNEMMGETFGPAKVGGQTSAKVEYDGMVGYVGNYNLTNAPKV